MHHKNQPNKYCNCDAKQAVEELDSTKPQKINDHIS